MKKILTFLTAIAMSIAVYADTIPEGYISGTWTLSGSPYLITGMTSVPDGSTLTIEAGVTVEWQGNFTMYIQGRILALGTETDSILFTAADPELGFKSIRFIETGAANDTSRFEHCIFEYGNVYGVFPDNCGGALAIIEFSKVIIKHCLFRNNQAVEPHPVTENSCGGAIVLWGGSPGIRNCAFKNNKAYSGGAILCYEGASPLIENSTFDNNRAIEDDYGQGYGGAVCAFIDCDPTIRNNSFSENYAENGGGALAFVQDCLPVIDHNLFYKDTASWGGAIELQDNCVAQIINNTIADNYADLWGGGIHCWTASTANVWNSILWNNAASNGSQILLQDIDDMLNCHYSDIMGGQSGVEGEGSIGDWVECIDEDPMFEGSDTCYYHLTEGSPCIDASDPECIDPIDNTVCDMGAFWCNYLGVGNAEFKIQNSKFKIDLFPNPVRNISHFAFRISQCQCVTLKIYDMYGKEVRTLADGTYQKGEYNLQVNVSDLPAGIYLVRLQISNEIAVAKLCKQ
jgi:predicted outer membrane repeat protein